MAVSKQTNKQGYVIARSKSTEAYFTSSTAYDRPEWVPLTEATVYVTPEMAQDAAKKLWKNGSFAARITPLQELVDMKMEMPGEEDPLAMTDASPTDEVDPDADADAEMVAAEQDPDAEAELKDIPGDEDDDDLDGDGDPDVSASDVDFLQDEEQSLLGQHLKTAGEGEETAHLHPEEIKMLGRKRMDMKEAEFKMPTRPGNDPAKPSENKTTTATMTDPKSTIIDYKDPVGEEDKPETDLCYATAHEHFEKVSVPADIMSQLKATVAEFDECAKDNINIDDVRGSFCMTCHAALQQLVDDLALGTVGGIKQAQIHMSSYMNPITMHIPADVVKYILRGGRKPSIKDLFDVKWDKLRGY